MSPAQRSRPPTVAPRAVGLDVVRTLAAFGVLVTHVSFVTGVVNPERVGSSLRLVLPRLDVGVSIFFVLSGLLVTRPFVKSLLDDAPRPPVRAYLLRRALRIFPLYWAVLAATLVLATDRLPVEELVPAVLLLHVYRPSTAIGPITQSWTLATEIAFYLLVPLWFAGVSRWARRAGGGRDAVVRVLVAGFASWFVVSLVWRLGVVAFTDRYDHTVPGAVDVRGALLTWLPNHLDTFAVGALLAVWIESGTARALGWAARVGCYAIGLAALWIASAHLDLPPLFTGFDGPQTLARHWLFVICAAALVLPSAVALSRSAPRPAPRSAPRAATGASGATAWRPAPAVATLVKGAALASYGVYLWHQLVTTEWFARRGLTEFLAPFPTTLLAVAAISTLLAAVTYWLLERPAMDLTARGARGAADAPTPPRRLGQHRQLDGLRGLAVLAVLLTHVVFLADGDPTWSLRGGFLGVDVFLVLSGFLIGGALLRTVDSTGGIGARRFAIRRVRRLVPALVAFLAVQGLVALVLGAELREQVEQALFALSFTANWQLSLGIQPPYELVHLWSLSLEGQFYVLLALAVWLVRTRLSRPRAVVAGLVLAAALVALWRLWLYSRGIAPGAVYERTDARLDSVLFGLAAACAWRSGLIGERTTRIAGAVGMVLLAAAMAFAEPNSPWLFEGGFTVVAAATAAIVLAAADGRGIVAKVADIAVFRWFGVISYSLYLWHLPVYLWVVRGMGDAPLWAQVAVAVPGAVLAGQVSFHLVERWTLAPWRRQLHREPGGHEDQPGAALPELSEPGTG